MDATRRTGTTKTGPKTGQGFDLLQLILSEKPGPDRLNGEIEFSPTDEDAKRLCPANGDVSKLAGRELTIILKELKPFNAKISARGHVVFQEQGK